MKVPLSRQKIGPRPGPFRASFLLSARHKRLNYLQNGPISGEKTPFSGEKSPFSRESAQNGMFWGENGANSVQNGSNSGQNGANSVQNGANSVQNGANSVQNGANSVQNGDIPTLMSGDFPSDLGDLDDMAVAVAVAVAQWGSEVATPLVLHSQIIGSIQGK
jgi:hypothetical protein